MIQEQKKEKALQEKKKTGKKKQKVKSKKFITKKERVNPIFSLLLIYRIEKAEKTLKISKIS